MNLPDNQALLQAVLILLALAVVWVVLRVVLKLTARLFTIGCLVLLVLGALAFLIGKVYPF